MYVTQVHQFQGPSRFRFPSYATQPYHEFRLLLVAAAHSIGYGRHDLENKNKSDIERELAEAFNAALTAKRGGGGKLFI